MTMTTMMMLMMMLLPIPQLQNLAATVAEANALIILINNKLNNDNDTNTFHLCDEDLLKSRNSTLLTNPIHNTTNTYTLKSTHYHYR